MRMIAWNSASQPIATNDVVLPISDEMDCRACHASGTANAAAQPAAGWVWDGLPERDYRLNILRLHDERQFLLYPVLYASALAARGFNAAGLYRSVTVDNHPALCAACYRCHPGSTTRCLRGAMGSAIAADGSMAMQCQSCHGNMSQVGSTNRVGWFMEPACQSCHSGTATVNRGQLRYTSAFTDTNGTVRTAADPTFATTPDTPAPGLSLYRFSVGHGGLQCEACHGSTHAEFPSSHRNDNLRNLGLQGHVGVMVECTACHTNSPSTVNGGPHGLHPVGSAWVSSHHDLLESGQASRAQCQACHGADYRGTVLSRLQADRALSHTGVTTLFRGAIIGCYTCHNGPDDDDSNGTPPPSVAGVSTNTTNDKAVAMILPATGTGLSLRIISQAANGSVGLVDATATYFPNPGFVGTDTFTFAAYDGSKNSGLATGTVSVAQGPFALGATTHVPPTYPAAWPVAFAVVPSVTNNLGPVSFDWDFGDGGPHDTNQFPAHTYTSPGSFNWTVISTVSTQSATNSGAILIGNPVVLSATPGANQVVLSWPNPLADTVLETSSALGPSARWTWVTAPVNSSVDLLTVTAPASSNQFFRVRRPW